MTESSDRVSARLARSVRAAFDVPPEVEHGETDAAIRRRRFTVIATLVLGVAVHGFTLRLPAGDDRFYLGTVALAVIWGGGALLSGPLHLGLVIDRDGKKERPWILGFAAGVGLLVVFMVGALVVAQIPVLREPVNGLLDHASSSSLAVVAVITVANGIVEELFYRGALYAAIVRKYAVVVSTIVYAAVTAAAGIALLTFAAVILGAVTALQRRVTGGVLAPIVTHVVWSLGMLLLLPAILAWAQ